MPAVGTLGDVDAGQLPHPLCHTACSPWGRIGGLAQELAALTQGVGLAPVGQEAHVSDPQKAAWHDVEEETPDAFMHIERHGLDPIALVTVTIGEADPAVAHLDDAVVGDGDPVGVAADVVEDLCRATEGRGDLLHQFGGLDGLQHHVGEQPEQDRGNDHDCQTNGQGA